MRKDLSPHVSSLLEKFVPEHIRSNYPQFIDFIRAYFDYLEESHGSGYYQNTLPQQRDIRTQEQEFLALIQKEIGLFVPQEYAADPKVFYDQISDLWRSKGSEEAIKTFFRLFLDDVVEIEYPWNRVLIPSDGRWIVENKLRVSMISGEAKDFTQAIIQQVGSGAQARVKKVEPRIYSDGTIYELTLVEDTIISDFTPREIIVSSNGLKAEVYKSVTSLNITSPGQNYQVGDKIYVNGFEGFSFIAFVSEVNENGGIEDVKISDYGAGNTPDHIIESNTTDEYYFKDFLLYKYSNNALVGPSDYVLTERPRFVSTPVAFSQDYTIETGVYFAEAYTGEEYINQQNIDATEISSQAYKDRFKVESDFGVGANFSMNFGALITRPGRYVGVRGQLDESIVLQDSDYYQKFSYEVSGSYSSRRWIDALKRSVHPAGMSVFSNVRIDEILDNTISDSTLYIAKAEPPKYETLERPRLVSDPVGFSQDYTIPEEVYFAEAYVGDEIFSEENVETNESSSNSYSKAVYVTQD